MRKPLIPTIIHCQEPKYALKGVDGLKTGSSPRGAFNYIATIKRGNQRLIAVIMGVGDWADQDGEYYRHPFGNALIEKPIKILAIKIARCRCPED